MPKAIELALEDLSPEWRAWTDSCDPVLRGKAPRTDAHVLLIPMRGPFVELLAFLIAVASLALLCWYIVSKDFPAGSVRFPALLSLATILVLLLVIHTGRNLLFGRRAGRRMYAVHSEYFVEILVDKIRAWPLLSLQSATVVFGKASELILRYPDGAARFFTCAGWGAVEALGDACLQASRRRVCAGALWPPLGVEGRSHAPAPSSSAASAPGHRRHRARSWRAPVCNA